MPAAYHPVVADGDDGSEPGSEPGTDSGMDPGTESVIDRDAAAGIGGGTVAQVGAGVDSGSDADVHGSTGAGDDVEVGPVEETTAGENDVVVTDAGTNEGDTRRWLVLAVVCLGLLVTGIDGTIVNVALPTLVRHLHASSSQLQWIVDAYTIIFASFLLVAGSTGDKVGRRTCFASGLAVFGAGSVGCSLVHTPAALIVMRGIQGFGAAFIMPATLSIIANSFTDNRERARAIAIWAGVSGLGVAIGPLSGGYLLEHFWWGSIFLVNAPIVVVAIIGAIVLVPESRDQNAPALDLLGTLLSTTGLIALLYGIIEGPGRGWGNAQIVGSFLVAFALLGAFVVWEQRTDHPVLDVRFFANPRFTAASIAVTLVFFAMFGSLFFVSQFLQFVLGYTAFQSGVRLLPVAVVLMVAAPLSAKLVARVGTKQVVTLGLVLVAAALLLFSRTTDTSGYGLVAAVLIVIGVGMGFAMAPATESIMGSLPPEKAGVGSAMNDTTREIGGALGVAIMGSLTASAYTSRFVSNPEFATIKQLAPKVAAVAKTSLGSAAVVAASVPPAVSRTVTFVANDAFIHALDGTVVVAAVVALIGAVVALVFLPARAAGDDLAELIDGAAQVLGPVERRSLAYAALGLFADAGMSSLTYSGISARSGIGTATLEHYWTSRVDAVTDALQEVFREHPIPDTGDLTRDLDNYLHELGAVISEPRARQVLGALIGEAATNAELTAALRERVIAPRRAEFTSRLQHEEHRLSVDPDIAVDQLVGPLYHRALIVDEPIDDRFISAIIGAAIHLS